jgi:hypothetical protein
MSGRLRRWWLALCVIFFGTAPGLAQIKPLDPEKIFACTGLFEVFHLTSTRSETKEGMGRALQWFVGLERGIEDVARAEGRDLEISRLRKHGLDARAYVAESLQQQKNLDELGALTDGCFESLKMTGYKF